MKKLIAVLALFVVLAFAPHAAMAQVGSNVAAVNLSYSIGESITVGGFPLNAAFTGATPTTPTIAVTTTWILASTRSHIDTNLYFSTPSAALSDGAGHNIPVANVFANIGSGAYSACNTNPASDVPGATAGGTCNVGWGVAITNANLTGSSTSNFTLQLQSLPTLPAGTYSGVLNIAAGAN